MSPPSRSAPLFLRAAMWTFLTNKLQQQLWRWTPSSYTCAVLLVLSLSRLRSFAAFCLMSLCICVVVILHLVVVLCPTVGFFRVIFTRGFMLRLFVSVWYELVELVSPLDSRLLLSAELLFGLFPKNVTDKFSVWFICVFVASGLAESSWEVTFITYFQTRSTLRRVSAVWPSSDVSR